MKLENELFSAEIDKQDYLKVHSKYKGAVIVAFDASRFLLIKIKRNDGKYHWEFPRGISLKNESYINTAIRELNEETGLVASAAMLIHGSSPIMPDSELLDTEVGIVEIQTNFNSLFHLEKRENIIEYKLVTSKELQQMINMGKIRDAFTLAAITYCGILKRC